MDPRTATAAIVAALAAGCVMPAAEIEAGVEVIEQDAPVAVEAALPDTQLPLLDTSLTREGAEPVEHTIVLRYPLLPADHTQATAVNDVLRAEVEATAAAFLDGLDPSMPMADTATWIDGSYVLGLADDRVLSLSLERSEFAGGAHPVSLNVGLTFDLVTGERLDVDDLVGPDGRAHLAQLATEALVERFGEESRELVTVPSDGIADLRLDPDGLVLLFDQYEYSPGPAGPQEVRVPASELAGAATARLRALVPWWGTGSAVVGGP